MKQGVFMGLWDLKWDFLWEHGKRTLERVLYYLVISLIAQLGMYQSCLPHIVLPQPQSRFRKTQREIARKRRELTEYVFSDRNSVPEVPRGTLHLGEADDILDL